MYDRVSRAPQAGGGAGSPRPLFGPLHVSEMRTYLRCPREWAWAYGHRRVPLVRPEALLRGTAMHRWLASWWEGKPGDLPADPIARACCLGYAARYMDENRLEARAEVPFVAKIGSVEVAGTVDAVSEGGLVEHKTTSSDIAPGSSYWKEIAVSDSQISMYAAAFPCHRVIYDVIRQPSLRKLRSGKPNEETDDELVARCLDAMAAEPERYFQRAVMVRLEHEHAAFVRDVELVDDLRRRPEHPRNSGSCHAFGRRCGFFGVCWEGQSIEDDTMFQHNSHGE